MQLHHGCQQHITEVSGLAAGVEDQLKTNYQLYIAKPGAAGGAYADSHAGAGLQLLQTRLLLTRWLGADCKERIQDEASEDACSNRLVIQGLPYGSW
jgi:hypothetical protein